jgi:AcrR family transcriptional regulator
MTHNKENIPPQKVIIRHAALAVFNRKGYSGATMAEIASCARVNPATIYRYFNGKQELFQSLQRPDLDFPDEQEQKVRLAIMKSALRIFSEKSYAAATMDEIAEAAGLSKPGIYFYYPSKEKLFSSVLTDPPGFTFLESSLKTFLSDKNDDLEKGLVDLARTYLSLFTNDESVCLLKIVISEGTHNADIAAEFKERIINQGSKLVAEYLNRFCTLQNDELQLKIKAFFGMLFSWGFVNCLLLKKNDPQLFDLDLVAKEFAHLFIFGIQNSINKQFVQEFTK